MAKKNSRENSTCREGGCEGALAYTRQDVDVFTLGLSVLF